ncbi:beta-class carbonic anhydrase [Bacillus mycoides]|uniref:beta-class carbonic anhydrase n=1 Tax=Bacillus mycoides TaxID=1405 RepID=UPI001C03507D|nr:carbonic anhydrase [Bacillus mycoides]MED1383775.1 carbonic anhydrase [Bacillus mycoides]QWH76049.1 carbonic anhydrase [Bacillus mycoides]QWI47490.1 carbonic anhydrase [Bacillus mycoides]
MSILNRLLAHNQEFVTQKHYKEFSTNKFPDKKILILTCMDTRLLELLPKALGLRNGDAKIIKNAGAVISHPFGSIMRSIIIGVYQLQVEEVFVIGHHDCGMANLQPSSIIESVSIHGIDTERINILQHAGIDFTKWLTGFSCVKESVANSVEIIQNHPLMPTHILVHGMVIDPKTGQIELVGS